YPFFASKDNWSVLAKTRFIRSPVVIRSRTAPESMDPQTTTLMLENTFFVFTEKKIFVVPRAEYESFQTEDGLLSVKRSSLLAETDSDKRVICILCHEETKPEDLVSPLCRAMH
ncbi:MAG: uncharacterized protein A8A55_3656, partial [Amphiamblys sp. WSBS2006]